MVAAGQPARPLRACAGTPVRPADLFCTHENSRNTRKRKEVSRMTKNVIRDGQTRKGHIDGVKRLHESLTFDYRPMLAEVVEAVESAAAKVDTKAGVQMIAAETTKHLVDWSEEDDKGGKLAIEFENVRRLPFPLLNKLYRVVAGMTATDEVPGSVTSDVEERLEELRKLTEGVPPVVTREEAAKN